MREIMLSEAIQRKLAAAPEHAMDVQLCDLQLRNGGMICNALIRGCRAYYTSDPSLTSEDIVDANPVRTECS